MLDRPVIDGLGYSRAREIALSYDSILVTKPSIVTVRRSLRSLRVSLSIGALLVEPASGIEGPKLTSPEWVEGCRIAASSASEPILILQDGEANTVEGRLIAIDYNDPIALALNGLKGSFHITGAVRGCIPIVELGGSPVVGVSEEGSYCTSITDKSVVGFLEYLSSLYRSCQGR